MKKFLTCCVLAAMMLGICGCAEDTPVPSETEYVPLETEYVPLETDSVPLEMDSVPSEIESVPVETAAPTETMPSTIAPTEIQPEFDGDLFLSTSGITFSLQGESEDIYAGSIPREEVTWSSEDESIAVFEEGVVTATGVGSTTVYAQYGDMKVECPVSCLAQTQEELDALSSDILHSPRKLPPAMDETPATFYDDAAIIGDSISYSLFQWAGMTGELGNPVFLVRGGMSINGYVYNYKKIGYQGVEMRLEEAVAASGVNKIFIMMGTNDLGYNSIEKTLENLKILLDRIWELSPEVEVYIESCLPLWEAGKTGVTNALIDEYNAQLILFAEENNCHYVEVASYIKDHTNGMAKIYCTDFDTHMNYDGTDAWMQALKGYGWQQMNKENG